MSSAALIHFETLNNINPGQSIVRHWNNATPGVGVWQVQAVPIATSFTAPLTADQSVQVETRTWRRLNRTLQEQNGAVVQKLEHEIYYEVKNTGNMQVDVDIYASIVF